MDTEAPTTVSESILDNEAIGEFRRQIRGTVLTPGDAEYEEARRVRNGLIDRHPAPILSMPLPFAAIQSAFDLFFPQGLRQYWKSTYVDSLSDGLLDALCALAATRPSPRTTLDIWLAFEPTWTVPADDAANIAWAREAWASMRRFAARGIYLNFPGFGEEPEALVRAACRPNYARLMALKTTYDRGNLFRMNVNFAPLA